MPTKPLHACNAQRCPNLTGERFCPAHAVDDRRRVNAARPSAHQRGFGKKWQEASKGYLALHPLCVCCPGTPIHAAQCVDHKKPPKLAEARTSEERQRAFALFWDRNNWQSSCITANSRKAAREEGGFGNRRAS